MLFQHPRAQAQPRSFQNTASSWCLRVFACTFMHPAAFCGLLRVLACTSVCLGNVYTHQRSTLAAQLVLLIEFSRPGFRRMSRPTCQAMDKQINRQTDQQSTKQASKQASKPTKQANRTKQRSKRTIKQTNKQTNQQTNKQTSKKPRHQQSSGSFHM